MNPSQLPLWNEATRRQNSCMSDMLAWEDADRHHVLSTDHMTKREAEEFDGDYISSRLRSVATNPELGDGIAFRHPLEEEVYKFFRLLSRYDQGLSIRYEPSIGSRVCRPDFMLKNARLSFLWSLELSSSLEGWNKKIEIAAKYSRANLPVALCYLDVTWNPDNLGLLSFPGDYTKFVQCKLSVMPDATGTLRYCITSSEPKLTDSQMELREGYHEQLWRIYNEVVTDSMPQFDRYRRSA